MYFADYHCHTNASPDGVAKLSEYLEVARRIGLQEFAVTDHMDLNTNHAPTNFYLDPAVERENFVFREQSREACDKIRLGIEIGHAGVLPEQADEVLGRREYDVVLSSLHNRVDAPDCSELNYRELDIPSMLRDYLTQLAENLDYENFDIAAHLTYPHRYILRQGCGPIDLMDYRDCFEKILKKLIRMEKALEFNTSCLRQDIPILMPDLSVAKLYYSLGGRLISIGSDAHLAQDLASGIKQTAAALRELGFTGICTYRKRKRSIRPL